MSRASKRAGPKANDPGAIAIGAGSDSRSSSGLPLSAATSDPRHAKFCDVSARQPPLATRRTGCFDSVVPFNSSVWSDVTPRAISVALASDASGLGARWPVIFTETASGAVAAAPPVIDATMLSTVWPLANFKSVAVASACNCGVESSPLAVPLTVTLPDVRGTISASCGAISSNVNSRPAPRPPRAVRRAERDATLISTSMR